LYKSRDWLYRKYKVQKKTIPEIAKEADASVGIIHKYLKDFKLL
jgi:hypothetical protein